MKNTIAAILALCAFAGSGTALAQQPIVIKFSHVVAAYTPKGKTAEFFKNLVEERTKGAVKVEVYHNSVLYKDKEELEALQLGAVQMLAPTPGKFGPLGVREFEVLDLPFLFDNIEQEHKVTQGAIGRQMLNKLETKGITGLAFWDNGFKQMTANRPLRKPEDFKGLKMRIQSSKVIDAQMRALGALPQVMGFGEVYQALQTGVVDGQENPTSNIYPSKLHEVQKYLTMSDHGYHGYAVIVNKKFWDGLAAPLRATLEQAMVEATAHFNILAKQDNDEALQSIIASGKTQVITLTPEERKAWKKVLMKVHTEMADKIGKDLIQSIYRETGFDPAKL
ncbi:MAG: TRAP transporter substrate-binding protein [Proteobacteria bacterium]|nr:TRAP transporter substrate-binding protein [Pseudomonadota bacterium]